MRMWGGADDNESPDGTGNGFSQRRIRREGDGVWRKDLACWLCRMETEESGRSRLSRIALRFRGGNITAGGPHFHSQRAIGCHHSIVGQGAYIFDDSGLAERVERGESQRLCR